MKKAMNQIKNYIQLHTSEMDQEEYAAMMRELAQWCGDQADLTEYGPEECENDD